MATVITDDKYYKDIADEIRKRANTDTLYKPSEMVEGVVRVYAKGNSTGYDEGYNHGQSDGYLIGENAESAKRDAQEAQYLADINAKVIAYGVSEAETLSDVPQVVDGVYNKGVQTENDRFWDAFQDYGNRTDYAWVFRYWGADYIRPKYKIQNITLRADSFFQSSKVKKIEAAYFDFTGINALTGNSSNGAAYCMFNVCRQLEEIEDLNIPAGAYYGTWRNCVSLKKIAIVRCTAGKAFTYAFDFCEALEDVTFTGTMSMNGLNLQYSPKLNRASIESLINVLSPSTSGLAVTLSADAVNSAFETALGANDGSTSGEWATKILEKSKWTISLI